MTAHVPVQEIHFKSHLKHAERMRIMFGGFRWYGRPQPNLITGHMYFGADDFLNTLREMQVYCIRHVDHELHHALIYVFDGREGRPKFHHYLWKPHMGAMMDKADYWQAPPDDFYSRHAFDALMAQRKPVKVSTVVNQGLKRVRKDIGADGSDDAHLSALRVAVGAFIKTNPLIHSVRVESSKNPYGGYTMLEHFGIYDREPKWFK